MVVQRGSALVMASALGVPIESILSGDIEVSAEMPYSHDIRRVDWDVADILLKRHEAAGDTVPPYSNAGLTSEYAFMRDPQVLAARADTSVLWRRLGKKEWSLEVEQRAALCKLCLAMEQKLKGVLGIVDFSHSCYYTKPEIITGIAQFLATGNLNAPRSTATKAQ